MAQYDIFARDIDEEAGVDVFEFLDHFNLNGAGLSDEEQAKSIQLMEQRRLSCWHNHESFWIKHSSWPWQLSHFSSTENHFQSANALCLVQSDDSSRDRVYTLSRNDIIDCGKQERSIDVEMYSKFFQTEKTTGQARLLTLYYYPQALELKHGYMAVGGNMGQVELYCYACSGEPIRFKLPARNHTMTTAVHISRIRPLSNYASNRDYVHVMTCSMNEYGVRFFVLPTHSPGSCYRNSQIETCQLLQYGAVAINDAKISPDGRWMVCACDGPVVFLHSVTFNDQGLPEINAARKLQIPLDLIGEGGEYTSQYVAWSRSSEYFAHTSDSHQRVLVWRVATQEILYSIHTGLDTYAIEFNPACDGVLAFISRRGHFQTVNLEEAIDPANPSKVVSILDFDKHVVNRPAHTCSSQCDSQRGHTTNHLAYRTRQLIARQEIVLVPSSDGDSCPEACLPRITGIRWSSDGRHLYIALRSRLLAYRLAALNAVDSLAVIAARHAQDIFEQGAAKSKLTSDGQFHQWLETLENVPDNIRERVTGDTSM